MLIWERWTFLAGLLFRRLRYVLILSRFELSGCQERNAKKGFSVVRKVTPCARVDRAVDHPQRHLEVFGRLP